MLFAGIAAEGLVYGEAEGGESDENMYKGVISQLQPPWGPGKVGGSFSFSHDHVVCFMLVAAWPSNSVTQCNYLYFMPRILSKSRILDFLHCGELLKSSGE